ncbi:MAG: hypothetical protein IBX55_11600 [Methyloprofundus sp.]|uniref:TraE/TraK family type IV conjugative transfer system protein n=1 Tax=Thiomicrospira sp. TaxID=935 RepID=UPI0019E07150|nr:hypothetical protein [Methyloprofundus sp.]
MSHADTVITLSKSRRAWQLASLSLATVSIVLSISLLVVSNNTKIVLVPYSALTEKQPITINGEIGLDTAYLSLLSDADLALFLNWTPKTVESRLDQLKFRLSPSALAANLEALTKDAKFYKDQGVTQSFFPTEKKFEAPNKVIVKGFLNRSAGTKPISPVEATYVITYAQVGSGMYVINSLEASK